MPYRRPSPCTYPGCPNLSPPGTSKCQAHAHGYNSARGSAPARGYDRHHNRLRLLVFARDQYVCRACQWMPDTMREWLEARESMPQLNPLPPQSRILAELLDRYHRGDRHLHADHILTIKDRPDLRLDLKNMRTLCSVCHDKRSFKDAVASGRR